MVRLAICPVSIPYGSIRRMDFVVGIEVHLSFQFLMVRLEGAYPKDYFTSALPVSIPYGSIRSGFVSVSRASYRVSIPYGSIRRPYH